MVSFNEWENMILPCYTDYHENEILFLIITRYSVTKQQM